MQKKLIFLALTGLLCLSLAGCGQSGSTSPEGGSSPQAEQPAEETAGEDGGRTPEEDGADTEAPQYTDNFSIDTEAVTAFAEQIQADRIFSEELVSEIAGADPGGLAPSKAGFALSASGRPNVVFSVVDGRLAIVGINY